MYTPTYWVYFVLILLHTLLCSPGINTTLLGGAKKHTYPRTLEYYSLHIHTSEILGGGGVVNLRGGKYLYSPLPSNFSHNNYYSYLYWVSLLC